MHLLDSTSYDPEKAKHIHRYSVRLGLRYGHAFLTGEEAEGVAIWMPPGRSSATTWMFLRSGGLSLAKTVDPGVIDRMRRYGDYSEELHHRAITAPHWYLLSVAVDRAHQGKGFSKRLLEPALAHFDGRGEACYLETHNPNNVDFYENLGFEVAWIGCLPGTRTTHWSMLRQARRTAGRA
ncbi:MAG: GNAT family N-acetyltransferase [Spirochaetaceae bacterium]|nr:GNAT family N-acetyltransferase [Spirochaetaceae bacterium]